MTKTMEALEAAGDRALAGENPYDTFLSYGLTVEDAALWCVAFAEEITEKSKALGEDVEAPDFTWRLLLGALAVGCEHGKTTERARAVASSSPVEP